MTRQEAFEKALRGLWAQGCRSVSVDADRMGACKYRGDNNYRCAIGWLIPDDEYRPEFEYRSASELDPRPPVLAGLDDEWLDNLQAHLHDILPDDGFRQAMLEAARDFAEEWDLVMPDKWGIVKP